MILPIWHGDRETPGRSVSAAPGLGTAHNGVGGMSRVAFLVSNTTTPGRFLFRQVDEYEFFINIVQWHLGTLAHVAGGLLTPCSYELVIRIPGKHAPGLFHAGAAPFPGAAFSAMLSHHVLAVNRKYGQRGGLFARGFRKDRLESPEEVRDALNGIAKTAKAMELAFQIPVRLL